MSEPPTDAPAGAPTDQGRPDEEDLDFYRVYGPWRAWTPVQAAEALAGFPHPWWVVGGHAIEAFTGVRRSHEDIDISFLASAAAIGDLRAELGGRFHLWSNDGGTFRVIDDRHPEPLQPLAQIWVREHALAPWLADFVPSPQVHGLWQSKRDDSFVADVDEVTWVHSDGVRYLCPEVTLSFKAQQDRPKDRRDLAAAWPLLDGERQTWLAARVRRQHPDHPWNAVLRAGAGLSWDRDGI